MLPSIAELNQIDDLMVGINNGVGVLAVTGRVPGDGNFMQKADQTHTSVKVSENCFSTYNTPKFQHGYEFFPQLHVKKNPHFGQMSGRGASIHHRSSLSGQLAQPEASNSGVGLPSPLISDGQEHEYRTVQYQHEARLSSSKN